MMLKKYFPLIAFTAAAYGVVYYLRNKAAAGSNLQYVPLDVAIDSKRTAEAGYSKIYYRIKLRLVNDEPASVNVRSINLNVTVAGNLIGKINNTTGFTVEANSNKTIQLDASFQTVNIVSLIQDLILNGFEDPINVTGFIQTDLGRIEIKFSKSLSGGISAPQKFNKSYEVIYLTKAGKSYVAKNIQAKTEEEAKEILKKQMKESVSFDRIITAFVS